jgi:amino acid adenylation domain-containing protein
MEDTVQSFPLELSELDRSVVDRFERVVALCPDCPAIVDGPLEMTYAELNRSVNRVAHAILAAHGSKSEPVALLFDYGVPAIITILAVLKAGKFYLPLVSSVPEERNRQILEDAGCKLIIADRASAQQQPLGVPTLIYEDFDPTLPDHNPAIPIQPDTLSYLIYTSGSTGQPKGVPHTHFTALFGPVGDREYMQPGDRVALMYSYNFGLSRVPIFGSLLNGAALCFFDLKSEGVGKLAQWLVDQKITYLSLMPSMFRPVLRDGLKFPDIRIFHPTGEHMSREDVAQAYTVLSPDAIFRVSLGTTETNKAREWLLTRDTPLPDGPLPMGYEVKGWDVMILDENHQPVARGEVGEIGIRSRYLSPGYWRDPEETARKFLPDPDGGDRRIFLTGDMGLLHPDESLQHLGRKDDLVKIRGFRVELAEVEIHLRRCQGVQEAVVLAQDSAKRGKRLIAYILPNTQPAPTSKQLRSDLAAKLPDYMIPSRFMFVESLPSTPTGKIDRQGLPPVDLSTRNPDIPYVEPRNRMERLLAHTWEEVLDMHPIGITDVFAELGGDSLRAMEVFARIEGEFGKRLPLDVLQTASTIAALAEAMKREDTPPPWPSLVPLQAEGTKPPLYIVHGLGGHVYSFYLFAQRLGSEQPVYALRAQGLDGVTPPYLSIEEMAAHYLREIREVQPHGPYYLSGFSGGGKIAFEMARQLRAMGETVALVAAIDTVVSERLDGRPSKAPILPDVSEPSRTQAHSKQLDRLSLPGKAQYLASLAGRLFYFQIIRRARRLIERPSPLVHPDWSPDRRVRWAIDAAGQKHIMQPYDGSVVIFRTDEMRAQRHDPRPVWQQWAAHVEMREITGNHESIFRDPDLAVLVQQFRPVLAAAQQIVALKHS